MCTLFQGRALLQSHRWINPLTFAAHALAVRLPRLRPVCAPVYVMSTGRTGTTVLGDILSRHDDVAYLNEPKALWHSAYPGGDVIGSYSRKPGTIRLDASQADAAVQQRFRRLYGAVLAATGRRRIIDKNAELTFRFHFLRAIFPDARFILLTRNGHDACASVHRWSQTHGRQRSGLTVDWWGVNSRKWHLLVDELAADEPMLADRVEQLHAIEDQTDRAALEWALVMRQGLRLAEKHSACVQAVSYEQLTRQPRATLEAILRFCELSIQESVLAYGEQVLRVNPPKPALRLHPLIQPLFDQAMRELDVAGLGQAGVAGDEAR